MSNKNKEDYLKQLRILLDDTNIQNKSQIIFKTENDINSFCPDDCTYDFIVSKIGSCETIISNYLKTNIDYNNKQKFDQSFFDNTKDKKPTTNSKQFSEGLNSNLLNSNNSILKLIIIILAFIVLVRAVSNSYIIRSFITKYEFGTIINGHVSILEVLSNLSLVVIFITFLVILYLIVKKK
ncbi:hypothetical protein [Mycoplasma sp. P36-A1]|uniref:hypothetical protein n=1 Tax=Mycoplasma sp. P36-A1 TaxID=3252900 RepID=UPI003C2AAEFD